MCHKVLRFLFIIPISLFILVLLGATFVVWLIVEMFRQFVEGS